MKTKMNDLANHQNNFDDLLRAELQRSHEYLPDDNFTANVMAQLPAPKKLRRWQEYLSLVVPCAVITLLVLSQLPVIAIIIKSWVWLSLMDIAGWLQLSLIIFFVGLLGIAGWFVKEKHLF